MPLDEVQVRKVSALAHPLLLLLEHNDAQVAFVDLSDIVIRFRLRTDDAEDAVEGAGSFAASADADYTLAYTWHADDPATPGVYVVEVIATLDGTETVFPADRHWLLRIIDDVG